jgi:hypothetical protein
MNRTTILAAGLAVLMTPVTATQIPQSAERRWVFVTRALATGSSDQSEPAGYQIYSAFALEAGCVEDSAS